jgi:hypothetical protein
LLRAHGTLYWPDGDRDGFATGFAATAGEGRAFAVVVDFGLEADAAVAEARGSADAAAGFGLAGAAVVGADATGLAPAGAKALTDATAGFGLAAGAAVACADATGLAAAGGGAPTDLAAGFGLAAGAAVVGADATGLAVAGGGAPTDASAGLAAGAVVVGAGVLVRFPGGGDGLAV